MGDNSNPQGNNSIDAFARVMYSIINITAIIINIIRGSKQALPICRNRWDDIVVGRDL